MVIRTYRMHKNNCIKQLSFITNTVALWNVDAVYWYCFPNQYYPLIWSCIRCAEQFDLDDIGVLSSRFISTYCFTELSCNLTEQGNILYSFG